VRLSARVLLMGSGGGVDVALAIPVMGVRGLQNRRPNSTQAGSTEPGCDAAAL
jgi:hypothetical protein